MSISIDKKAALVYIAGYVCQNVLVSENAFSYYEKFRDFRRDINCRGVKIAGDMACQWTIYSVVPKTRSKK